ncbi:hypothetical protein DY000_02006920 [Brassica cretica]|uniref:DUF1985 domain-containing protein n=1 Tax=Brassica cretica TaxID=69181 RepID=A0ABQ7C2A1_BRACR|nr:hypothetical protein DY000_02006920 [Brassica cretica]
MAGDVSKRKEAPTMKLNKFHMETMMSEIMRRMKKSDLLQKKHADDFFDNVSQVSEEKSAEEAQKSSPPEEVLEQPNIEAETYAKSLSLNSQGHCKDLDMVNSLPEMFVMFMEHNKSLDYPEKRLELILQQPVFYSSKSFDSNVFKENSFVMSWSKHKIATGYLFSSSHVWKEFMVRNFQKPKSLRDETDFICNSVFKLGILCSESDKPWHALRSLLENCVVLSFDDILVYNTFFDKQVEPWLRDSRFELDLLCSEYEELVPVLKLFFKNHVILCLDTILVYNTYFDMHHQVTTGSVSKEKKQTPYLSARDLEMELKDEPEAGMEHNELILAMKNKTNKLEKLWIRFMDELGLFQPKRRSNIQDKDPLSLADEPATKFKSKKQRQQLSFLKIIPSNHLPPPKSSHISLKSSDHPSKESGTKGSHHKGFITSGCDSSRVAGD